MFLRFCVAKFKVTHLSVELEYPKKKYVFYDLNQFEINYGFVND